MLNDFTVAFRDVTQPPPLSILPSLGGRGLRGGCPVSHLYFAPYKCAFFVFVFPTRRTRGASGLFLSLSALIRANRTLTGSSLGSWGTSLPSNAFFKMLLVGIFTDHVLIKKAEGPIVRRGGEAD